VLRSVEQRGLLQARFGMTSKSAWNSRPYVISHYRHRGCIRAVTIITAEVMLN
jgi:hypothetical protein